MNRAAYVLMLAVLVTGYVVLIGVLWHTAGCSVHTPC